MNVNIILSQEEHIILDKFFLYFQYNKCQPEYHKFNAFSIRKIIFSCISVSILFLLFERYFYLFFSVLIMVVLLKRLFFCKFQEFSIFNDLLIIYHNGNLVVNHLFSLKFGLIYFNQKRAQTNPTFLLVFSFVFLLFSFFLIKRRKTFTNEKNKRILLNNKNINNFHRMHCLLFKIFLNHFIFHFIL